MTNARAHVITGGFPPGQPAGHDHDLARLALLNLLAERGTPASVGNDFADVEKWLPVSRLLVTYVAGPYPNDAQSAAIEAWLNDGGHWLALHGTSGGRAERVEGSRQRRTVKTAHHAVLGGFFLTHPPTQPFRVEVRDPSHPLTRGIGSGFDVVDEPYFVELTQPASTTILLTADYGPGCVSPVIGTHYPVDTSLQPDGRRVVGYTRAVGQGSVTYYAMGHCHSPASRPGNVDPVNHTFRGPWDTPGFTTLLRNAIAHGLD